MLTAIRNALASRIEGRIEDLYGIPHQARPEIPPRRDLGDLAFPGALQLARVVKKNPRQIGEEIAAGLELPEGVREVRVEGPGFLNFYLDRGRLAAALIKEALISPPPEPAEKTIVEHTNINPNKAAHIGHLRNAVLGDVLVRAQRALGRPVEVQNYIDDTGVQLADVVVGFVDLRGLGIDEIRDLPEPFDFTCWDLYAEVGRWYEEDAKRAELRRRTLHEIESGSGPRAEVGRLIARRIVSRHLRTMRRIGVDYDLITRESVILLLDFFHAAFERLKKEGAIRLETEGKNSGCWLMPLSESSEFAGLEDPDKIIVRSDGTVTYVGKDIAYQLWKFGLLGLDFGYRYWREEEVWESVLDGVDDHPEFGGGHRVINVIDKRQSYLQKVVRAGLERLHHTEEAARSVHFAYEMVALSAAAAEQLGQGEVAGDGKRLEMSGRKGIGVKADDLIDRLEAKSREEIMARDSEPPPDELDSRARAIATAALRFFMIKTTTNRVIAFDFDEALSFEGDSGPYLQYSLVRAANIFRRLREEKLADEVSPESATSLPGELWEDDLWELIFSVAELQDRTEAAVEALELSQIARFALELAQKFNAIYHRHPILQEPDAKRRATRLATAQIFAKGLRVMTDLMGLPIPERM
ncbi:MAG: arginine--tRNA ligase [bacterium]|nr:arginine--tRNA ligase [bacterium]